MQAFKRYAACLAVLAVLAGCSDTTEEPGVATSSTAGATSEASPSTVPEGAALDWEPVAETADVVKSQTWTLGMTGANSALLAGTAERELSFDGSLAISEVLLTDAFAVVVLQDPLENEPGAATVYPLDSEETFTIDNNSELATTNGGTWAVGEGKLFYATYQPKNSYCLAALDLASQQSEVAWCAADDEGFNDARATPAGLTLLTFKLGKKACRTPTTIKAGEATPIDGITKCVGWDSLVTPGGTIWSEIPDANRVEEATFFADTGAGPVELGPGDTGSLTWCGSAAYFTQQPIKDGDPATLLRWRAGTLDTVYETPGSPGFISEPRCGGNRITISAQSEGGDEQVSATVD